MLHRNNVEPRRSWSRARYTSSWRRSAEVDPLQCTSCGATDGVSNNGGVPFCADCLEWSRQDDIDELYDDLGLVD